MNYIYTLMDPVSNQIKYVGKTDNISGVLESHLSESKNKIKRIHFWIQGLLELGLKPIVEIIDEIESEIEPNEQYWIGQIKSWGFDLVNE
jgi:hypothetical protein